MFFFLQARTGLVKFSLAVLLRSTASCPSLEGEEQMCILLPRGLPFVLDYFWQLDRSAASCPVLAGSPCSLQPHPCAAGAVFCRLCRSPTGWCGSAAAVPGAHFGAGGVRAASAAVRSGQCWALPAPAPQQSRFSQALRQGASAGAPSSASRIFLGALGRA